MWLASFSVLNGRAVFLEPKYEILEWKLFQNMLLCRMKQKLVATYLCGGGLT